MNTDKNIVTLHMVIHGRVQGVFFRDSLRREAQKLAITGWVRNRSDGSVEALVYGSAAAVDAIIECARRGPRAAQVSSVEVREDAGDGPTSNYTRFETRLTVYIPEERIEYPGASQKISPEK